jgi:uncharacterized phage protein (TIGR02220 family)
MHADGEGWVWITQEKITRLTGFSRHVTEQAIKALQQADLLAYTLKGEHFRRHFKVAENLMQLPSEIDYAKNSQGTMRNISEVPCENLAGYYAENSHGTMQNTDKVPCENLASYIDNKEIDNNKQTIVDRQEKESAPSQKPKKEKPDFSEAACRLIDHLNAVAGTAFRHVKTNIKYISRVLETKEGTEEEFRMVIEHRAADWKNNPEMHKYLNPETLSRPNKFPGYLEKAYSAQKSLQLAANASGDMTGALVPQSQSDGLQIILPSGQQFGSWYEKKDARKIEMIKAQLMAHPGMEQHLNPQLADPAYLSALREIDLQHELRVARNIHQVINYKSPFRV